MQLPPVTATAEEIVWTQEEAIAFECARECIGHMMAIYTGQIAEEEAKPQPDRQRIEVMRAERSRLASERRELHVNDHAQVARVRAEYGATIRAWREDGNL